MKLTAFENSFFTSELREVFLVNAHILLSLHLITLVYVSTLTCNSGWSNITLLYLILSTNKMVRPCTLTLKVVNIPFSVILLHTVKKKVKLKPAVFLFWISKIRKYFYWHLLALLLCKTINFQCLNVRFSYSVTCSYKIQYVRSRHVNRYCM